MGAIALAAVLLAALAQTGCGGGGGGQVDPPPTRLEKKAARVERRSAKDPENATLLLASLRAWIAAGGDRVYKARSKIALATTPIPEVIAEAAADDFRAGLRMWKPYLRQTGGNASVDTAEQVGNTYFALLEIGSRDLAEVESNAAEAARALRIAGRQRHDLFTLSNVATYEYYNGEYAAGDRAARGAAADVGGKMSKQVIDQLGDYRERGETFRRLVRQAAAQLHAPGEEQLQEPLKAFASRTGLNPDDPSR